MVIIARDSNNGHRLIVGIATHQYQTTLWIQAGRKGVILLTTIEHKRGTHGISTPVDGINTENIALTYDRDPAIRGFCGVETDGNTRIRCTLGWMQMTTRGSILSGNLVTNAISRHHSFGDAIRHLFHDFHQRIRALTETSQNKRTTLIEMLNIVLETFHTVLHWQRYTRHRQLLCSPRLHRGLTIIGREVIEST